MRDEARVEAWQQGVHDMTKIDERLRAYAHQRAQLDADEAADLVSAWAMDLHLVYGCATMFEYMERRLGYRPHAARERLRVARALQTLPVMAAHLSRGELTYSAVRELTRVATPSTENAWVTDSLGKTVHEIEKLVAGHQRGDLPSDPPEPDLRKRRITLELPPEVYALWREARSVLADESGGDLTDAGLVESLCRAILQPGSGAEKPPHQISYVVYAGGRISQVGAGREIDVAPEVIERALCDARIIGSLDASSPERASSTVTPRMREQVFARDKHRCQVPGCRSSRNLEIHHIIPQEEGGPHELWNLMLICGGHHSARHCGLLIIVGEAPDKLDVRWRFGAPLAPGLSDAGREQTMQARVNAIAGTARRVPHALRRALRYPELSKAKGFDLEAASRSIATP